MRRQIYGVNLLSQEPINRSLYLLYYALESTLSRVDLFIERLSGEVSHAHSSKTQSKQSWSVLLYVTFPHDLALLLRWPSTRSDSSEERDSFRGKKTVLKIKLLGKGLTQEISGDRGSFILMGS